LDVKKKNGQENRRSKKKKPKTTRKVLRDPSSSSPQVVTQEKEDIATVTGELLFSAFQNPSSFNDSGTAQNTSTPIVMVTGTGIEKADCKPCPVPDHHHETKQDTVTSTMKNEGRIMTMKKERGSGGSNASAPKCR